jgi:aspartate dehydrogenase
LTSLLLKGEIDAFFSGDARTAALDFPQNAQVAAAVAMSGIGFEKTQVSLTVDPFALGNTHFIHALGKFGEISVTINGKTLENNPKTSLLAPLSLVR